MEKLEIKLTLTADSTPELLRYLRGISSARDRAFVLKRLATAGLSGLSNGQMADAILLPSPAPAAPTPPDAVQPVTPSRAPAPPARMQRTDPSSHAVPQSPKEDRVGPVLSPSPQAALDMPSAGHSGFEFLDLDALNAATAQFG